MSEAQWFSGRLRELREQAGLTQQQLAERAGFSQRAVSHWEQGLREPSWSNVIALAKVFGVDTNAFLQPPQVNVERPGPGRPRKAPVEGADQQDKRPRGRPRKAPAATQETPATNKATSPAERQQKPATRKKKGRAGQ